MANQTTNNQHAQVVKRCLECGTPLARDSPNWKKLCIYCYKEMKAFERSQIHSKRVERIDLSVGADQCNKYEDWLLSQRVEVDW